VLPIASPPSDKRGGVLRQLLRPWRDGGLRFEKNEPEPTLLRVSRSRLLAVIALFHGHAASIAKCRRKLDLDEYQRRPTFLAGNRSASSR
jgi:hypothetical protein